VRRKILPKIDGFLKLYKKDFALLIQSLSDREVIFILVLLFTTDWDPKHENTYGFSSYYTAKELIEAYLPSWSEPKISEIRKSLISKKMIEITNNENIMISKNLQLETIQDIMIRGEKRKNRFSKPKSIFSRY